MRLFFLPIWVILFFFPSIKSAAQTNSQQSNTINDTIFKTAPGTAFFWSGRTGGIGGADIALTIAKKYGGITLEGLIAERNVQMPAWNPQDSSTIYPWMNASAAYARQVSGLVRAVIGDDLRPGNVWSNTELGRLISNANVTEIIVVDPKTEQQKVVFKR